jgi:Mrp family chromosome partitioning ATPase/capsular polysaccharide biosynthesis protein
VGKNQGAFLSNLAATISDIHILEQLLAVLRRRWRTIALSLAAGLFLGLIYGETQAPQYASSAIVIVRSGFAADPMRQGSETTTPEEEGQFLSQLELIKSSSIAGIVAAKFNLEEDPAFDKPVVAGWRKLVARVEPELGIRTGLATAPKPKALTRDQVIARLQANVKALRAGRTYVAAISYTHSDPATAQKIAQAYAEAFRQKLAEVSDLATSRVRAALQAELDRAAPEEKAALQQKYHDLVVSRALPGMDAVIISDAKLPGAPIAPRKGFLVAVGAILGAALGCLLAGYQEMSDRGVRDGDRLARRLGTRFLGYAPLLRNARKTTGKSETGSFSLPDDALLAVNNPYARFSETVRSAAVAALSGAEDGKATVVGLISVLPGEGKTLVCGNLAAQIGNRGKRVLLIDGHFRDPDLTSWLVGQPQAGLTDTILQGKPTSETMLYDRKSNISFLPVAATGANADPAEILTGKQMASLLEIERATQDIVIIDLPALTSASDAIAIEPLVDRFILVSEWGGPSEELIADMLLAEPAISAKLAGVVMTKTDLRGLSKYVSANSRGAFQYRIG